MNAQAKQEEKSFIRVQMTYCNLDNEEIKYFTFDYSIEDLEEAE